MKNTRVNTPPKILKRSGRSSVMMAVSSMLLAGLITTANAADAPPEHDAVVNPEFEVMNETLYAEGSNLELMNIVDTDLAQQLANIRRMEANGELAAIPKLPEAVVKDDKMTR